MLLLTKIFHGTGSHDRTVVEGFTILSYLNGFHTLDIFSEGNPSFSYFICPCHERGSECEFPSAFVFLLLFLEDSNLSMHSLLSNFIQTLEKGENVALS